MRVREGGRKVADGRVFARGARGAQIGNGAKCGTKVGRPEGLCVGDDREVVGGCKSREKRRKEVETGLAATASPLDGSEGSTIYRSTFADRCFSSDTGTRVSEQPSHTTGPGQ